MIFDPNITLRNNLSDGFRVFATNGRCNDPAHQIDEPEDDMVPPQTTVYISGSNALDESGEYVSGGGIWFGQDHPRNKAIRVPRNVASTESGELAAILYTLKNSPCQTILQFKVRSEKLIDSLTKDVHTAKQKGWIGMSNKLLRRAVVTGLRGRGQRSTFSISNQLDDTAGKEGSRDLAKQGICKNTEDSLDLELPDNYNVTGTSLAHGTQALFYQGIRESKTYETR